MKSDPKLIKKLQEIIRKSRQSLEDATLLNEKASYDSAASLAYYAVFHALQALLLSKGLAFSKHAQVKGAFNKEFIHTELFPKSFSRIVEQLFKDRHIGDYEYGESINKDRAHKDISDSKHVIVAITDYLKDTFNQDF